MGPPDTNINTNTDIGNGIHQIYQLTDIWVQLLPTNTQKNTGKDKFKKPHQHQQNLLPPAKSPSKAQTLV
jgi:hypothetical protein